MRLTHSSRTIRLWAALTHWGYSNRSLPFFIPIKMILGCSCKVGLCWFECPQG